jgi:hypothetical protein
MDEDQRLDLARLEASLTSTAMWGRGRCSGNRCATRIRKLSRIITRVYDDAHATVGTTASHFTLLTRLAQQDGICHRDWLRAGHRQVDAVAQLEAVVHHVQDPQRADEAGRTEPPRPFARS